MFQPNSEKMIKTKFAYHAELIPIKFGAQLLAKPALQPVLKKLKVLIHQPEAHYQYFYQTSLERLAELVQSLPSYKNKTYNNQGGLLDLAVTRAYLVLSQYRQQYPIYRIAPDEMPAKLSLWSYALFTASLFYNVGYIATNFYVATCDSRGYGSKRWNPMQHSMIDVATHFRFSFLNTNYDALASRYTILFAKHLMTPEGLAWIASDIELMDYWLAILQDDERGGGLFATQIMTAEEKLLLQDLDLLQLLGVPSRDKMLNLQDHDRLEKYLQKNQQYYPVVDPTTQPGDISIDPLKGPAHIAVAINERDVTGGQVYEIGERFIAWLRNGIKGTSISINRPESGLHITNQGALLALPQLLQEFLQQNPQLGISWQYLVHHLKQMGVILAQIPVKQSTVSGPQFSIANKSQLHSQGVFLLDPTLFFNHQVLPEVSTQMHYSVASPIPSPMQASLPITPSNSQNN